MTEAQDWDKHAKPLTGLAGPIDGAVRDPSSDLVEHSWWWTMYVTTQNRYRCISLACEELWRDHSAHEKVGSVIV